MAKKKPNKLFDTIKKEEMANIIENTNIISAETHNNEYINEKLPETVTQFFQAQHTSNISDENMQKIENYEKVVAENKRVYDENALLIEKAAEYSEQREELLKKAEDLQKLYDELKIKYDALQEENDNYLIKISELTFENAKLNAKLDSKLDSINDKPKITISSSKSTEEPINKNSSTNSPSVNPYKSRRVSYLNRNNNGYSNWN